MVLMDAPGSCWLLNRCANHRHQTRDGKSEKNSRIPGAAIHSYEHENLVTISDVSKTLLSQVEEFFVSYNPAGLDIQFLRCGIARPAWHAFMRFSLPRFPGDGCLGGGV